MPSIISIKSTAHTSKRRRILDNYIIQRAYHLPGSVLPFRNVQQYGKPVNIISHRRISRGGCSVINFFFSKNHVLLPGIRKKEKICFVFVEVFYDIFSDLLCFEYPINVAGDLLQVQKSLDKKCIVVQEGEISGLIIFPSMMEIIVAFVFKIL